MTVRTNTSDFKKALVEQMEQLFTCLVEGYNGVNGCYAWGDFTGSAFDHSADGFENVRNIADFQNTTYGGGGSIDFVVPQTMTTISQTNFYNKIKAALASLGVNI